MLVYTLAIGALLLATVTAQSFYTLDNLSKSRWRLNFGLSSNGTERRAHCFGGADCKRYRTPPRRREDPKTGKTEYWYESVPIPPVVVAAPGVLNEGACKRQLEIYIEALRNGTLWATQMFDASAKYPHGVFEGHTRHLGNFDQCYRINAQATPQDEVRGRYCLVDYKYERRNYKNDFSGKLEIDFDPNAPAWEAIQEKGDFRRQRRYALQLAICVPANCGPEDVRRALQAPFSEYAAKHGLEVLVSVEDNNCQAYHEEKAFSTGATVYCGVLLAIFVLVVVSSLYDGTLREDEQVDSSKAKTLLLCFSARRNWRSIFNVRYEHRGFDTIHMIRFFSTVLVVFGHRLMQYSLNPVANIRYLELTYEVPSLIMLHNGPIIIDGFFGIGGMLSCYGLLSQFDKMKRMNFIGLTFIRLMRFLPGYALLLFFHAYLFEHLGSGPHWKWRIGAEAENCANSWWWNLLFVNNYVSMENLCLFQSWYLAVDYQCYILSIFLIYGFWKWPRKVGYSLLAGITFISILIPFYYTYFHQVQPLFIAFPYLRNILAESYFLNYYVKTHMRMNAYWVGVIVGALIHDYHKKATWRISKAWSQGLFILLVIAMSLYSQSLGFKYYNPNSNPSTLEMALYAGLHRATFSASFCFIVLLITVSDGLDFHYNFLTPRWVQPLGRLTYSVFLAHNLLQTYQAGVTRQARTFAIHNMFFELIPDLFYTYVLALLITLGVEGPFRMIEKHFIIKRAEKVPKKESPVDTSANLESNNNKID